MIYFIAVCMICLECLSSTSWLSSSYQYITLANPGDTMRINKAVEEAAHITRQFIASHESSTCGEFMPVQSVSADSLRQSNSSSDSMHHSRNSSTDSTNQLSGEFRLPRITGDDLFHAAVSYALYLQDTITDDMSDEDSYAIVSNAKTHLSDHYANSRAHTGAPINVWENCRFICRQTITNLPQNPTTRDILKIFLSIRLTHHLMPIREEGYSSQQQKLLQDKIKQHTSTAAYSIHRTDVCLFDTNPQKHALALQNSCQAIWKNGGSYILTSALVESILIVTNLARTNLSMELLPSMYIARLLALRPEYQKNSTQLELLFYAKCQNATLEAPKDLSPMLSLIMSIHDRLNLLAKSSLYIASADEDQESGFRKQALCIHSYLFALLTATQYALLNPPRRSKDLSLLKDDQTPLLFNSCCSILQFHNELKMDLQSVPFRLKTLRGLALSLADNLHPLYTKGITADSYITPQSASSCSTNSSYADSPPKHTHSTNVHQPKIIPPQPKNTPPTLHLTSRIIPTKGAPNTPPAPQGILKKRKPSTDSGQATQYSHQQTAPCTSLPPIDHHQKLPHAQTISSYTKTRTPTPTDSSKASSVSTLTAATPMYSLYEQPTTTTGSKNSRGQQSTLSETTSLPHEKFSMLNDLPPYFVYIDTPRDTHAASCVWSTDSRTDTQLKRPQSSPSTHVQNTVTRTSVTPSHHHLYYLPSHGPSQSVVHTKTPPPVDLTRMPSQNPPALSTDSSKAPQMSLENTHSLSDYGRAAARTIKPSTQNNIPLISPGLQPDKKAKPGLIPPNKRAQMEVIEQAKRKRDAQKAVDRQKYKGSSKHKGGALGQPPNAALLALAEKQLKDSLFSQCSEK